MTFWVWLRTPLQGAGGLSPMQLLAVWLLFVGLYVAFNFRSGYVVYVNAPDVNWTVNSSGGIL